MSIKIIGGTTTYSGKENSYITKGVTGDKQLGGRAVKLDGANNITKITDANDIPYGIALDVIGGNTFNVSKTQTICVGGRGIYAELDDAITSITSGTPCYITADGTITTDDAGTSIGIFESNEIYTSNGKKVCLITAGA